MEKHWQLPRRAFLKGVGTAITLPLLEAMLPVKAVGAPGVVESKRGK